MHVIPGFATYDRDVSPAINNGVDIIRIGTHCTESTVSYSLINNLRTQPVEVISCLMMSHMASTDILLNECLKLEEKGVDAISIYDSAGCFDPDQITELFTALRAKLTIKLGFHGHNNLGLAVANSYQAYRCGVNILDASICAFGAGAGNTQLETLATYFKKKNISTKIDLKNLYELVEFAGTTYAKNKPFADPISISSAENGLFSGFKKHILKASTIYNVCNYTLIESLGGKNIVAGQEDQIYINANILDHKNKEKQDKKTRISIKDLPITWPKNIIKTVPKNILQKRNTFTELSKKTEKELRDNHLSAYLTLKELGERSYLYFDGPRSIGYGGYRKNQEKWTAIAEELIKEFSLNTESIVLDLGCAKGYLVDAL